MEKPHINNNEQIEDIYSSENGIFLKNGHKLNHIGHPSYGLFTDSKNIYYLDSNTEDPGESHTTDQGSYGDIPDNDGSYHPVYDGYGLDMGFSHQEEVKLEINGSLKKNKIYSDGGYGWDITLYKIIDLNLSDLPLLADGSLDIYSIIS